MLRHERGFTSHPRLPFKATGSSTPPDRIERCAGCQGAEPASECRRVGDDSDFARDADSILVAETIV
jgi:hypothetical protein